jgi:hypothetical protein
VKTDMLAPPKGATDSDRPLAHLDRRPRRRLAAIAASIATRVELLPDVIDVTTIPTGAGLFGLLFSFYGALRRFDPDRLGRLTLAGNLLGGLAAALFLAIALIIDVL